MQRLTFTVLLVLTLFTAAVWYAPAWAGEYEKCTMDTQACLNKMTEMLKTTGWVGIEYEPREEGGLDVKRVVPESPAAAAGLEPGDLITAMYGIEVKKGNDDKLKKARKDFAPGQEVVYTVLRDGANKTITLTLAPMPADVMAQWIGRHMMDHAQVADVASANP